MMIKDIWSGSSYGSPTSLTAVGDTLFFQANDGDNGTELWKSDGTSSGTVMVKDIDARNPFFNEGSSYPRGFTAVGNTIYFTAKDGIYGYELWKYGLD